MEGCSHRVPRQCKVGAGVRAAGIDSLRDRTLAEGQRRSEETLHRKGSLGHTGSPDQRLDWNKGWTGGLGSRESHKRCFERGEIKRLDLMAGAGGQDAGEEKT